jgi:hypothetical protein
MHVSKNASSYNEYTIKASMGEIQELHRRFADDHAGPVADEIFRAVSWYLDGRLPGPGEEKEEEGDAETNAKADELLPTPDSDIEFEPEGGGEPAVPVEPAPEP